MFYSSIFSFSTRLSRLLYKQLFEEAEKFAIAFELDLEASLFTVGLLKKENVCLTHNSQ